ncbi:CHC2 zinc finger domain-containing protein [Herbivorax sp. ANBcel31]|uniref:CHC2 zinc finger domain-containing protein n=1 Tax=Herbivorax sp. ANBcel31 TaxID=3069754 RepID=UPI0027AF0EEB|nr:CHC2 zinc finger domain-containing protein [Herbivorax sp. ANBcel31]MDQ2086482.1 CHC2 zinc finger domain-containing protein [Herbivorax sp. ANBcel31]
MSIFTEVKANIKTLEVAKAYGLNLKRKGSTYFCVCPFHKEKTGSFAIYPDRGFYCHGCGVGGDVIKLTELLFNLNPLEAAHKIASDFNIPVEGKRNYTKEQKRQFAIEQQKLKDIAEYWANQIEVKFNNLCNMFKLFRELLSEAKDMDKSDINYQWVKFHYDFFDRITERFAIGEIKEQLQMTQNIQSIYEIELKGWENVWTKQLKL